MSLKDFQNCSFPPGRVGRPDPLDIDYDSEQDVITIEGVKYHADLFRQFGGLRLPSKFVATLKDEVVTIKEIE